MNREWKPHTRHRKHQRKVLENPPTGLVLTRKVGETVIIGDGADTIKVTIVDIQGDRVQMCFDAPMTVPIDREEIRLSKEGKL